MILYRRMHFSYPWCDSLCILQDVPVDLMAHIKSMDTIYRSASLTIVAAAGPDTNAGLPGVRRPRAVSQHTAMVKGYELTTVPELPTFAINSSVWSRRAWTYQELRLSHRIIGFLPDQTYFQCQSTNSQILIYEATIHDCNARRTHTSEMVQKPRKSGRKFKIARSLLGDMMTYTNMVEDFTARELTYESDVLNAFSGMIASFNGNFNNQPTKWISGMPTVALSWCLCWESGKERPPRPGDVVWNATPAPTTRCAEFPSWSWAGWKTRVCMGAHHSPDAHARSAITIVTQEKDVSSGIMGFRQLNQSLHDEYGFHIAPYGSGDETCDMKTGILTFKASCAKLRVARELTEEEGSADPNFMRYRLTLPQDDQTHMGFIALDAEWRRQAPDLLDFVVVHAVDGMRRDRRRDKKQKQKGSGRTSRTPSIAPSPPDYRATEVPTRTNRVEPVANNDPESERSFVEGSIMTHDGFLQPQSENSTHEKRPGSCQEDPTSSEVVQQEIYTNHDCETEQLQNKAGARIDENNYDYGSSRASANGPEQYVIDTSTSLVHASGARRTSESSSIENIETVDSNSDKPLYIPARMRIEPYYSDSEDDDDRISDIQIYLMCVKWVDDIAYRVQIAGGDRSPEDWMKANPVEKIIRLG